MARVALLTAPGAFVLAVALLPTGAARADAIGPPPADCVPGSEAVFCHGPPTCGVLGCTSDGDCTGGRVCRPAALCIEPHACGGILGAPVYDHAISACAADGGCPTGGTCSNERVCVLDPTVDGGPLTDSGSELDSGRDFDSGAALDTGTPLDGAAPRDTSAPAVDTGGGSIHTTYGCGCRAAGAGDLANAHDLAIVVLLVSIVAWRVGSSVSRRGPARRGDTVDRSVG